jgi:arylsulfatase A-like enzyme
LRTLFVAWIAAACTTPPDVILLTVDTLRADHVSALNPASPVQTPGIDQIAADGVVFTQAYSPISVTAPAFASVLTGLDPGAHGVMMNVFRGGDPLASKHVTLAERLDDKGYSTAGFVSAYTLRREVGLAQGFDVFNGGRRANRWGNRTAALALSWLEVQEGPVMLWYHSYDPHGPVKRFAKAPDREQEWSRDPAMIAHVPDYQLDGAITDPAYYKMLYQRGVALGDRQVGRIVASLKASGRYDKAMIIVLSDHGETFTERTLWFDHGTSSHDEQLRVPLIIKYPKGDSAGTRDDRLVSLIDVAPTVLDALDLRPLEGVQGLSLRASGVLHAMLSGESSHCKRVDVLPCAPHGGPGKEVAIRSLGHALIRQSRGERATVLVYDRTADPHELQPTSTLDVLRDAAPEGLAPVDMAQPLHALWLDRLHRTYAPMPELGAEMGGKGGKATRAKAQARAEYEKLKSLGYVE